MPPLHPVHQMWLQFHQASCPLLSRWELILPGINFARHTLLYAFLGRFVKPGILLVLKLTQFGSDFLKPLTIPN